MRWTLPDECSGCKDNKENDDRKQLARYKELYLLLTVKGRRSLTRCVSYVLAIWRMCTVTGEISCLISMCFFI